MISIAKAVRPPFDHDQWTRLVLGPLCCRADMATVVADCNPAETNVVWLLRNHGYADVQRKRLPVGDYQVSCGDSVVLIERKTLEDWRSSMIDGRLDAQRTRAGELFAQSGVKLVYILEGNTPNWSNEYHYGVTNRALAASVVKMGLRDGHHVLHTPTIEATAAAIAHIANELESGGLKPEPVSIAAGVLGKRPRDIRGTLPPLVAPLASITGVSLATAELLAATFATASKLVGATEKEIADTQLKSGRRVGEVVAKRVKLCFQ